MGRVENLKHATRIFRMSRRQHFVGVGLFQLLLQEIGDGLIFLVHPGILISPMGFEVLLHVAHLFAHGFFGVSLHATVYCRVDLQAVLVGIEVGSECFHFFGHRLTEVKCVAVVGTLHTEFQFDGLILECVVLCLREAAVCVHIVQHNVATLQGTAWIALGVVGRSGFE